jgi:hypothetical protein
MVLAMMLCVVLPAQPVLAAQAASGHEISGVYAVQQSSNAGSDTQVTLRIGLTSGTDATLQSTSVALRSVLYGFVFASSPGQCGFHSNRYDHPG